MFSEALKKIEEVGIIDSLPKNKKCLLVNYLYERRSYEPYFPILDFHSCLSKEKIV